MVRYAQHARGTTVTFKVLNPRNRNHVPASYLRDKAVRHIMQNHDQLGRAITLNFETSLLVIGAGGRSLTGRLSLAERKRGEKGGKLSQ